VDQGTHSHETPLTILIRRIARDNTEFHKAIFGDIIRVPTLTQYLPELFYFDCKGEDLYCSAFSGLPLVRYDLKDKGGVMSYEEMLEKAKQAGVDLEKEIKKAKISDYVWKLPFVWLYERRDMVVSWYGANIYPEHIREALLHPELQKHVSGRFVMTVEHNDANDPELHIHTELRDGVKPSGKLEKQLVDEVINSLLAKNSEYGILHSSFKHRMVPKVKVWNQKHPPYFHLGGKQRWVIKK
jgi:phenylacetate-CoA ligase